MRCPTLNDLPKPSIFAVGFPWTEESPPLPDILPDATPLPKISIVTPSFNQGQFIEETIRSVLLQGYPNLEYIIIDGGSTDDSVAIIKKYEPWLTHWESVPDRGQSHAINKGFSHTKGEILGWINSDDLYSQNSLGKIAKIFIREHCDVLSGNTIYLESGNEGYVKKPPRLSVGEMLRLYLSPAPQPSTFWSRKSWDACGPLDENLHYRMDYALFLCFAASRLKWTLRDEPFAYFRKHRDQKTWSWNDPGFHRERETAIKYFSSYGNFAQVYAKDIQHGLKYEGWLVSWMAVNQVQQKSFSGFLKMLTAPLYNVRCLILPMFYRKATGMAYHLIKNNGFRKNSRNVKRSIRGSNNFIQCKDADLSSVVFDIQGHNNQVYIAAGCILNNVTFRIRGDNHSIAIQEECIFRRGGNIWFEDHGCSLAIGAGSTFEDVHLALTESGSRIDIGRDCMFAYDIDVRTGDSHSIIDARTGQRINYAGNISIEDHIWVAAHVTILKGVVIGRNSVLSTGSVVTKDIPAESIAGGVPAKVIRSGVTWMRERMP